MGLFSKKKPAEKQIEAPAKPEEKKEEPAPQPQEELKPEVANAEETKAEEEPEETKPEEVKGKSEDEPELIPVSKSEVPELPNGVKVDSEVQSSGWWCCASY
jgi:hypothetical protein